jgi:hypothetical protein
VFILNPCCFINHISMNILCSYNASATSFSS